MISDYIERVIRGGFPSLVLDHTPNTRDVWVDSYLELVSVRPTVITSTHADPSVMSDVVHPLHRALIDATEGRFPDVDGAVEVVEPMAGDPHAVVEFTGHSFVVTNCDAAEVSARGADGFGGASQPDLLRWLAGPDGWIGPLDAVLFACGVGGGRLPERSDLDDHPRVMRSRAHRRDVRVHGDDTGLITIGRGLVDRLELSVEVLGTRTPGAGRRLIGEALALIPAGDVVFAQVAPGNAASLRAFLSCGFVPIGAEILLQPAL